MKDDEPKTSLRLLIKKDCCDWSESKAGVVGTTIIPKYAVDDGELNKTPQETAKIFSPSWKLCC